MTNRRAVALAVAGLVYLAAASAGADPILKPRKYYGPIPQSSLSLRVGMLGGASNDEMTDYLDGNVRPPFEAQSEDFGNGLSFELAYMHKPHPNFGIRVCAGLSILSSSGSGDFVAQVPPIPPDSLPPVIDYSREFNVQLVVVELSGVYQFGDASVKEFQPYIGGGFSLGFPHEEFKESRIVQGSGQAFTDEIPGIPAQADEWGFSAGVHAVGGAIYYLNSRFGISGEARLQLMEGKFEQLSVANEVGDLERVNFVIDYTGFYLTMGVTYAF